MIGVLGSFCCCGGEGCSRSCGLTSYLVSGLGGLYSMRKEVPLTNKCVCSCLEDGVGEHTTWNLDLSFQQVGSSILARQLDPHGENACCYRATGSMRVSGTFSYAQAMVCCMDSPVDPARRCSIDQTYSFDLETDFCYTVICSNLDSTGCLWNGTGAKWIHILDICDFGLAETADFLSVEIMGGIYDLCGLTSGSGCPTYSAGIVCGGAHLVWTTPMKDFRDLTSAEFSQKPINVTRQQSCNGLQWPGQGGTGDPDIEGCMNYVEWLDYYSGPFSIHQTREFSDPEGIDPWLPCSLGDVIGAWIGAQSGAGLNLETANGICLLPEEYTFDPFKPCWAAASSDVHDGGEFYGTCLYQSNQGGLLNVPVYT